MLFKRKSDGKVFGDIQDAIENFKCPGPCCSHCPLFDMVTLSSDARNEFHAHKCHPDYAKNHPYEIARLIGCEIIADNTKTPVPEPKFQYNVVMIVERELEDHGVYQDKTIAIDQANILLAEHMKRNSTNPDDPDIRSEQGTEWCYANEDTMQARSNYYPNADIYVIESLMPE